MINCYVTYMFESQKDRDNFYAEIKANDIGVKSCAEEGNIRYSYYFPAEDDTRLFLWEQWKDMDAFNYHKTLPHFIMLGEIKTRYKMETDFAQQETVEL